MRRRQFITLLGGAAAVAWPLAAQAQAQQGDRVRRIGVLMNNVATDATAQAYVAAFVQRLHNLGWTDGQNLRIEYRWNAGRAELARGYAAELVALAPDAILCASTTNLSALQRLSPTTPIVFVQVSDPVTQGFVLNLAHPGGNITGFTNYEFTIGGKWVDLVKQLAPATARVAVMFNPQTSPQSRFFLSSVEAAALTFGVSVIAAPIQSIGDIEAAIETFSRQPNSGLIFPPDSFTDVHRNLVVEAAARYRVPAIYSGAGPVRDGGLMGYGPEGDDQFRQAAFYVDRILNGTKAGDLPVQIASKFTLAINLKAAKALGIELPLSLMLTADEVIE
jgi:putative tryptophan/tyrosine transport system substrate-binding protein